MTDLDVLKDIPGYKAIMKSVLKSQIQLLIEQLSAQTGEESIILTASVHDGTLSHLGSSTGKGFLEGRDEIKSQFLGYCLKTHHRPKSTESNKSPYQRPVPSPRSPTLQQPPQKRQKVHPVSLISRQQGTEYPIQPPPRLPQRQTSGYSGDNSSEERELIVKQEVQDTSVNESEHTESQGADHRFPSTSTSLPSSLQLSHTQTSADQTNYEQGNLNQPSVDAEDSNEQTSSIKIEPITENEMELEITGVELGDSSMSGAEGWGQGQSGYGAELDGSFNQGADQSGYNMSTWLKKCLKGTEADKGDKGDKGKAATSKASKSDEDNTEKNKNLNICGQCGKTFKYKKNLLVHERAHAGVLPFACCGKGFSSRRGLERHRCTVHGDAKNFACKNCSKKFATSYDLTAHQRREKQAGVFVCDTCSHKCSTLADLREHLKTHASEKTHVCRQCGEAYKHSSSLFRHLAHKHK